jgi:uncharacterized protein
MIRPAPPSARPHNTTVRYSFLRILTGSDLSRRRLPFMQAHAERKGPTVWLTACAHGDEVGGIVIIQEIFKRLQRHGLLRGKVFAFPLMNPIGFETASRSIPFSKEDLNRSFPGHDNGSLGERIAARIFKAITETSPALVIDLHNDWIRSIPYAVIDPAGVHAPESLHRKVVDCAHASGLLVIREDEIERTTLSYSLIAEGIPALTLEMGESYVVNERNIDVGVRCVWNLLTRLGLATAFPDGEYRYPLLNELDAGIYRYTDKPLSSTSGIIRFLARPGQIVETDQPIARIYNAFGKSQETLHATAHGVVLGHADSSVVFPGMAVMAFGIK